MDSSFDMFLSSTEVSHEESNNERLDSEIFEVSENMSATAIRSELLRLSYLSYKENKDEDTVHYQSEALGIQVEFLYDFNDKKKFNRKEAIDSICPNVNLDKLSIEDLLNRIFSINNKCPSSPPIVIDKPKEINNIFNRPRKIPKNIHKYPAEWTIIQLCKEYNSLASCLTHDELFETNSAIYLSLIKYPQWELNGKAPICIKIESQLENNSNIYRDMVDIVKNIDKLQNTTDNTLDKLLQRKMYADLNKVIDSQYSKLLEQLIEWLGPWICLFIGINKSNDLAVFNEVEKFCKGKSFSSRQIVLINLVSRGVHLLDDANLKIAAEYISSKKIQQKSIIHLFATLKSRGMSNLKSSHYPCILIIDELLDQIPWEMILPNQEFTRLISLDMLHNLLDKYGKQIEKGYYRKSIVTGNCCINPASNLDLMQKRMKLFFNYWMPHWNLMIEKIPSEEDCLNFIKSGDVYVYCGHGSGLQYIKSTVIVEQQLDCIIFLVGCNSTRMESNGHNIPMSGTHVSYHIGQCPTILGMNTIVTDYEADVMTATIFMYLIKSKSSPHFRDFDRQLFRNGTLEFTKGNIYEDGEVDFIPNLCEILCKVRTLKSLLRSKCAVVLRGLPLWNSIK